MIGWLKRNWAIVVLVVIVLSWFKNNFYGSNYSSSGSFSLPSAGGSGVMMGSAERVSDLSFPSKMMINNSVAPSESANRVVIQDTSLSLQVKDVSSAIKSIELSAKDFGGFLVNSYLSKPDVAASGNITVRVPDDKRKDAMEAFKGLAVKVVSESVSGDDVTDQYVDLQSRLDVLNKTKLKYEEILDKAVNVQDLLSVQQQLTSLQQQIDSVKGQQKYYEQSAKLTKITVYLSTDDLALPYAPSNEWRPAVVFKEAVRSLVGSFRSLGSLLIWGFVYVPIIIPIVGLIWFYRKKQTKVK